MVCLPLLLRSESQIFAIVNTIDDRIPIQPLQRAALQPVVDNHFEI